MSICFVRFEVKGKNQRLGGRGAWGEGGLRFKRAFVVSDFHMLLHTLICFSTSMYHEELLLADFYETRNALLLNCCWESCLVASLEA